MPAVSARRSISSCTCRRTDSILFAIEKCLSSRLETCLVIDDAERLVGSIALDDLRRAIVDGTDAEGVALDRLMRDLRRCRCRAAVYATILPRETASSILLSAMTASCSMS